MKKLLFSSGLLLLLAGTHLSAQVVIDLRTGVIDGTNTLISVPGIDDTWEVCPPGSSYTNPGSYQPAYCIAGTSPLGFYGAFDPAVGLISPDPSETAVGGYYYYKMRFYYQSDCKTASAIFNFSTIGADDALDMVIVNNYTYTPSTVYGYNPFATNISFSIPPVNILQGWNEVIMRVYNWGGSMVTPTGMHINGKLTIQHGGNAAFSLTAGNSPKISATSTFAGTHTWKIYTAPSSTGPFTYVNYSTASSFTSNAPGPCYYVVHTISNECGEACESKMVCQSDCEQSICTLTKPDHLTYDAASQHLSWDPVPNAVYYDVQVTLNDPACCGGWSGNPGDPMQAPTVNTIRTYDIEYDLQPADLTDNDDMIASCFSWKVIAYCPDGTKSVSGTYCSNSSGGTGNPNDPPAGMIIQPEDHNGSVKSAEETPIQQNNTQVNIFPNPAKDNVSLEIKTTATGISANVTITDVNGKVIKTFEKLTSTDQTLRVKWNTANLSKGVYMVSILTSDHQLITQKLLIE